MDSSVQREFERNTILLIFDNNNVAAADAAIF